MTCVSLLQTLFRGDKSTILRGSPLCFGTTTILCSHVVGTPSGTFSITPSLSSSSNPALTLSLQWMGSTHGVWCATGFASLSTWKAIGSAFINGSGWCGHLLNVDAANVSNSHFFILGMLLALHGNGSLLGLEGGGCLSRQPHGARFDTAATVGVESCSPAPSLASHAVGNVMGITYSSVRTCQDR